MIILMDLKIKNLQLFFYEINSTMIGSNHNHPKLEIAQNHFLSPSS